MNSIFKLMLLFIAILLLTFLSINLDATQPYWSTLPSTRNIERHDSLTAFDITKYELTLAINEQTHFLNGNVKAFVTARPNLTEITYDLMGGNLTVSQVLVNDSASTFTHVNGVIHIPVTFSSGTDFTTQVFYSGTNGVSPTPYGIGLKYNSAGGNVTSFYTLSNPDAGRYWWPSYDHPWDKALIDLHITVRRDWLVAANGTRQSIVDNGNETMTHNWSLSSAVATYVVGIAAGPFVEFAQHSGATPIQNFVFPASLSASQADFTNVPEMISYFSTVYGAYPFEKYGHVVLTISPYAAMEHQTMTTIGAAYINGNQTYETTIAHELAHQWMGNCVTPLTMQDVWLKESFATYSEFLWKCHISGWPTGLQYLASEIQNYYLNWENSNGPHTIYNPVYNELFAPPTYEKSASVLHMLRLKMGNTAFFNFIRAYFNTHANGNVITTEIIEAAQQSSGLDLTQFFSQWIYHAGIPSAQLTYFTDGVSHAKIYAKTTSNTTTAFDIEIPMRLANSALLDSIVVRATSTGYANIFTMNPVVDSLANIQIDPNHWVMNRGYSTNNVSLVQCLPSNQSVSLLWDTFSGPFELVGYHVWRRTLPDGTFQVLNDIPYLQLSFEDTSCQNGVTYQYYVTAVDTQGYQSLPSNILNATPIGFPFDLGFLLVDETRDGAGSNLSPSDQMVDDFYEAVLPGMPHTSWNLATEGVPSLSLLSHYPIVLWHSDDFSDFQIDDCISTLSSYATSGGKLVISGWKYPSSLPQSFFTTWFPTVEPTLINQPALISAQSEVYPILHIDPAKLPVQWNNMLSMAYLFPGESEIVYTAQLPDSITANGQPLAVRADHNGTIVMLGFPLYYMMQNEVQAFLHQILPELYPSVGVDEQDITPQSMSVICYPNPFNEKLNIRLGGKVSSNMRITIFNLKGQKVRQWVSGNTGNLVWDGKDTNSQSVGNGVYIIKIGSKTKAIEKKITLIRN